MNATIATGIEFTIQLDGTVIIEFQDDDGHTIATQVITQNLLVQIPLVAFVALTALERNEEVAKNIVQIMQAAEEEAEDGR